ncbi:serine hydrolase [Saccharothrix sp. BKS2]|uniref:serine hydrolase n=1 Tax=Saccharothrix sp. BKS2 TaxID=3064400 RepID=UPI0039EA247E
MTRRARIDDLTSLAVPEQPALSPDGAHAAYVLRTSDVDADVTTRCLWRVGTGGGRPERLTRGRSDTSPAWSPDGRHVAFLRAEDGPAQVWLLPAAGGEATPLTSLPLGAGPPQWSPDGTRLAFSAPVDRHAGDDRATAPVVVDRLDSQVDGVGLLRTVRRHLHVVDAASGECRQVTDGDWHAGAPAWSPDGTRLAFAAATAPDADLVERTPAHVVDVLGTSPPEQVGPPGGTVLRVGWTADGTALLAVGTTDGPVGFDRLLRLPSAGGAPVDLGAALDRNVMPGSPNYPGAPPALSDDGRAVLFCVRDRGCTHVWAVPVDGGAPAPVLTGAGRSVSGMAVAGGVVVVVLGTPTSFGELVRVDPATGAEVVLTDHGAGAPEPHPREEREFTVSDGTVVPGWLVRDPSFTGPRPLLLDIHGGPHNAWCGAADEHHLYHQELVAEGWVVLLLNPRGSDGYGEEFCFAALGAWGTGDARDFLEPLDELVAEGLADPERLAVAGYSYGGFMTCYLTSRDDRFAAAVAGGAISDLTSMVGVSDGGHFIGTHELRGRHWERDYAAMSPLARVEHVRTPTLLLHGLDDLRCPVGQARQWHTALRERGVPTRLVLYPGGSHLFFLDGTPSHRVDLNRRVADWVRRHAVGSRPNGTGRVRPPLDAAHWRRRLSALTRRHGVPGAVLGVLRLRPDGEDELVRAAYGVLNRDTGVEATADSVFLIGSITKVFTATLVARLADDGLLDLDAPVTDVLPGLRLPDPGARITARHLLTHTSGLDGDVFTDTGRGDDCVARYADRLSEVAQLHPPGATWSYCNSGFVLAGRLVEELTGGTWDAALRDLLITPLGLARTGTLPEEALLHRTAVGHFDVDGTERLATWALPRSVGPAGLVHSTAADVLALARLHLTGGLAPDGTRLLSAAGAAAMAAHQADRRGAVEPGCSAGLGWFRDEWDGRGSLGHNGAAAGQRAFLRLLPDEGLAVVLLTNGDSSQPLADELFREVFAELADVAVPRGPRPAADPARVDARRHVGVYERAGTRLEVFEDGGPRLRVTMTGPMAHLVPDRVREYGLIPREEDVFLVWEPRSRDWVPVTFSALPDGRRCAHFLLRAVPEVG